MRVKLDYGKTGLEVEVPDRNVVGVLGLHPLPPLPDPSAAVRRALADPIGCAPLRELARGRRDACVVVCDITRPVPNPLLLPPLLETLEGAGIPRERIMLLIATGIHRPNEGAEMESIVGPEVMAGYRIANHFAHDLGSHRHLGATTGGAPIYVDARYCAADLKIVTGLVEPHFMAGFSGGRKVVCPGIAALETVKRFHSARILEHPCADTGVVEGNPVHAFSLEVAKAAGVDFSLNVTFDEERRITGVFAGEVEAAWAAGVAQARAMTTAPVDAPVDVVVTSSAGYPLDTTYYQAVKGMVAALPILKPGGTILLAARMSEGIGSPDFARLLLESPDLDSLVERIRRPDHFVVDQWEVVMLHKAVAQAEVLCYSEGLDAATIRRLYATPVPSVEAGIARALDRHGPDARIAVIPKGPYVMPVLRG
ncbi:MAG: nickel-dependent lactate racemase [Armatimonadetes bacterium]|nr:nickel-dependent lactate racemase [Armatimonadota bacterium]